MKPSLKSVVSGNTNKGFESILHHRMEHSAMEKFGLEVHKTSSVVDWKPSPVVALATSLDESQVAVAREDCSLEIWLVSPGSVGWHCLLTIHGKDNSRISSLVWCRSRSKKSSSGRLLSSSIDGSILEWDLFSLKQKVLLDSIGVSIWQMAIEPFEDSLHSTKHNTSVANHSVSTHDDDETSGSDDDFVGLHSVSDHNEHQRIAVGCDDGCVRLYAGSDDEDVLVCTRSLPRVNGRILSVAWSPDATRIYSGSSDGFIRCWDAASAREFYRIQVGRGGTGSGQELCVWSLLALRCGTLVSADSSGSVQFWDGRHGTLVQAYAYHKGDANALAAAPSHKRVFSAGSDGQVILYKLSSDLVESGKNESTQGIEKWVYVGYMRAHTHDVRALTVAVPISREDPLPNEKKSTSRGPRKPIDFGYRKWAHLGVPMLISGGDDSKLFAYSAKDFTKFSPHDICPAPQRVPVQLVLCTKINGASVILVQYPSWLDVLPLHVGGDAKPGKRKHMGSERSATTQLLARVKCKASRKIICSTISGTGVLIAYSDHLKPSLFELTRLGGSETGKTGWAVDKRRLPHKLPFAHSMAFSSDSSRLMIAGYDRKIYVVDVESEELLHTFELSRREHDTDSLTPTEPPITRMCTSSDGQWLAAINCYGDIYIFSLETYRQHWFISRLNGACVTAGGFPPSNSNVLIITTSTNQVYAFDVDARELGEWSKHHTFVLPRSFQEFPGEVIGITFPPAIKSTQAIIYSSRAMCWIDFGNPVEQVKDDLPNGVGPTSKKLVVCENGDRKCKKLPGLSCKLRENFQFFSFRDPALFVGYLSQKSILVIEKPWMEVVKTFEAPVHRHIFGI